MEFSPCAIGIDLGGTRIKSGVIDAEGRILARQTIDTQADQGPDHVLRRIIELARGFSETLSGQGRRIVGLGVGAPGALSQRRGVIMAPPNLPGWRDVRVVEIVRAGTGLETVLENDANAAAWGEYAAGAGQRDRDMVMLTFGTGVGSGIIIDGRLHRGSFETGGELGHAIMVPGGRRCACGQSGCLEAYTSASQVARRVEEAIAAGEQSTCRDLVAASGSLTSEDVVTHAAAGDALSARIWDDACRLIAIACVNLQHVVNPQSIILGGGMAAAGDRFLRPVRDHFLQQTWKNIDDKPTLRLAELGDDAGFVGAAALLLNVSRL